MKKELPNVTVICVACTKVGEAVNAMYKTLKQIKPAKAILFTSEKLITKDFDVVKIEKLDWTAYNHFCMKRLAEHIHTDYILTIQWDGYVLRGDLWNDKFYEYDYIGAKWLDIGKPYNVGNGGFSFKSMKLQHILENDDTIRVTSPEDVATCKVYGEYLSRVYGIRYATEEIADKFSFELNEPTDFTFGFHAHHHEPFKEVVVVKRNHALGDVIMCEPVLEYYYKKGYKVAIDCLPDFYQVYQQHYFPVYFKANLNPKIKYKEVILDMVYENKPKQPVLKSYFEAAGIEGEPLRNSKLNIYAGAGERFFKKYAVIHVDYTDMAYRNIHGVDWKKVVNYLEKKGYSVFQVGKGMSEPIATHFNTMTIQLLMVFIKGADLVIASDSGVAQVSVGFNRPTIIMAGSVNLEYRYNDFENIKVVQNECPIPEKKHCYHEEAGRVIGSQCVVDKYTPPCCTYTAEQIINKVKELV